MNYFNDDFLNILTQSFDIYLKTNARSNEKLKILHQKIANDLKTNLIYLILSIHLKFLLMESMKEMKKK